MGIVNDPAHGGENIERIVMFSAREVTALVNHALSPCGLREYDSPHAGPRLERSATGGFVGDWAYPLGIDPGLLLAAYAGH